MEQGTSENGKRLARAPFVLVGLLALVCAAWGGLIRLPLTLPIPARHADWITHHGPLMVGGFLGTVIGLERAVSLGRWWPYGVPMLSAAGALSLLGGFHVEVAPWFLTAASAVFFGVTVLVVRVQQALFTILMCAGAAAWLGGNLFWLKGAAVPRVVPWWMAFLALTILGERLDLSRFQKANPWSGPILGMALAVFGAGTLLFPVRPFWGWKLVGLGWVMLASWLVCFDLARRTLAQPGLPRFMAICLLTGYFWLACTGFLMLFHPPVESGLVYDAILHAFFLGFVFSMIFGHAPVIFPSVFLLTPVFYRRFYLHVILLHVALLVRGVGDLAGWWPGRLWGGALNGVALAVFLANTMTAVGGRIWAKWHDARWRKGDGTRWNAP